MEWEQKRIASRAAAKNVWEFLRIRFFDGSMEDSWEGKWATDCENLSFLRFLWYNNLGKTESVFTAKIDDGIMKLLAKLQRKG